jgi:cyclopropane-fatty-acyl-phospholipid synthase
MSATMTRAEAGVRLVSRLHERLSAAGRAVPIRLWDGTTLGPSDAGYQLAIKEPWALRAMLAGRDDLTIGETYLADGIDVDGSMVAALRDLRRVKDVVGAADIVQAARLAAKLPRPPRGLRRHRVALRGRRHSQRRDSAAVRHHYDQAAGFFACFLDPALVYSCAYFAEEDRGAPVDQPEILARAQWRKLELICRKLALQPGERLLDVGCGWGSLVLHAARHHDVEAVGITLSPPQAEVARERIEAAGLADRVRVEVADYREVSERFDAVASVGMVEHVGAARRADSAATLHDRLEPGGRLLNHGITTGARDLVRDFSRDGDTFVGRHVFPDGALVPAHRSIQVIEQAGFEIWDVEQLRPHYARTLQHWVANLERNADRARELAGERTYRVWRAYMAGSVLGFESNDLGVIQVLATRDRAGDLPFGRDRMALPDAP